MKILQINSSVNTGSTGRIAEDIGRTAIANGHESYIAYGRASRISESRLIPIGSKFDVYMHGLQTLLMDRHGLASASATRKFVNKVNALRPDVVHLHNLHGYYLHVGILSASLHASRYPLIWTFHDCWNFTGHCTFFDSISCERWKTGCFKCPKKTKYPSSWIYDRSEQNYEDKKTWFSSLPALEIVTPSEWLAKIVKQSFLGHHHVRVIHNGVDLQQFKPLISGEVLKQGRGVAGYKLILGVASIWDPRKGLDDFLKLSRILDPSYKIVLIGLTKKQFRHLPDNVLGIERTESLQELAAWYNAADVFVNPTWQDNFPTTNLEALACGTPVITYDTGGSPESVDVSTGFVVKKGDINGIKIAIERILAEGKNYYQVLCRTRAEKHFNKNERYLDYVKLYETLYHREAGN